MPPSFPSFSPYSLPRHVAEEVRRPSPGHRTCRNKSEEAEGAGAEGHGLHECVVKVDVDRQEAVTADRRNRLIMKRATDAVTEQERPIFPSQQEGPFPQDAWGSHQSVASLANFSSPNFPLPAWGYAPSLPEYADGDALDGFNLNSIFLRTPSAFTVGHNAHYGYSPTYLGLSTMSLRRGPLPFASSSTPQFSNADTEMEEIINNGSPAAAPSPGFGTQEETLGIGDDMDEEEEVEEEPAEPELEPARSKRGKKDKRAANGKSDEPRVKWTAKEDECLAEAWKTVSMDPINDANQDTDTYWTRVKMAFDECKLVDPEFAGIHMKHGDKAKSNHWASIQLACHKWHGIQEEVMARPENGADVERHTFRRDNGNNADFKFLHVLTRIESCEKWAEVRLALAKAKDGVYNRTRLPRGRQMVSLMATKRRRRQGIRHPLPKGCKRRSNSASPTPRATPPCGRISPRQGGRRTKQDAKLDLLRTNVAAKKRNTDLVFLMGGGDTVTMDPQVKEWYLAKWDLILNLMLGPAAIASTTSTPNAPGSPTPTPTTATLTPPTSPAHAGDDEEFVI
ncbi:hypothetical protein ZWY2020_056093 [Hordeum vulgare]|nr:hypothetical protein ZWY2020_056093 [Hordeum vulgare]